MAEAEFMLGICLETWELVPDLVDMLSSSSEAKTQITKSWILRVLNKICKITYEEDIVHHNVHRNVLNHLMI